LQKETEYGGGPSPVRTALRPSSLLTGKNTGKFAIFVDETNWKIAPCY
jgi:hypothetical protein